MRRGFGFVWVAVTSILLVIVGVVAYQAGWSAGASTQVPAGAAAAAPYYYYGPHLFGFGFGLFGFFWLLFFLFLLFWLFRFVRFGRGWGHGGWGYRGWKGYGGGQGGQGGQGGGIPPAIDERMQEWHRRAHGEPSPTPPSDTKTV